MSSAPVARALGPGPELLGELLGAHRAAGRFTAVEVAPAWLRERRVSSAQPQLTRVLTSEVAVL